MNGSLKENILVHRSPNRDENIDSYARKNTFSVAIDDISGPCLVESVLQAPESQEV